MTALEKLRQRNRPGLSPVTSDGPTSNKPESSSADSALQRLRDRNRTGAGTVTPEPTGMPPVTSRLKTLEPTATQIRNERFALKSDRAPEPEARAKYTYESVQDRLNNYQSDFDSIVKHYGATKGADGVWTFNTQEGLDAANRLQKELEDAQADYNGYYSSAEYVKHLAAESSKTKTEAESALADARAQVEKAQNALSAYQSMYMGSLDMPGIKEEYERLQANAKAAIDRKDAVQAQLDMVDYTLDYTDKIVDKAYEDKFEGQFNANYRAGRLSQDSAKAWSDYVKNPTAENKAKAENVDTLLRQFQTQNKGALDDENVVASWITKDLAGHLPQEVDQTVAKVIGGLAGALVAGGTGYKVGSTIGSGVQSYNTMRGAAYKALVEAGVDEEAALAAAKDEAFLSSIIEMGDTATDWLLFPIKGGATKLAGKLPKAVTKVASALGKVKNLPAPLKTALGYLTNIPQEYTEEYSQEVISQANAERAKKGETGFFNLVGASFEQAKDVLTGKDAEGAERAKEAGRQGAKIAVMTGAVQTGASQTINAGLDAIRIKANDVKSGEALTQANQHLDLLETVLGYTDTETLTEHEGFNPASKSYQMAESFLTAIQNSDNSVDAVSPAQWGRLMRTMADEMDQYGPSAKLVNEGAQVPVRETSAQNTEQQTATEEETPLINPAYLSQSAQNRPVTRQSTPAEAQQAQQEVMQAIHPDEKVMSPTAQLFMDAGVTPADADARADILDRILLGDDTLSNTKIKDLNFQDPATRAVYEQVVGHALPTTNANKDLLAAVRADIKAVQEQKAQAEEKARQDAVWVATIEANARAKASAAEAAKLNAEKVLNDSAEAIKAQMAEQAQENAQTAPTVKLSNGEELTEDQFVQRYVANNKASGITEAEAKRMFKVAQEHNGFGAAFPATGLTEQVDDGTERHSASRRQRTAQGHDTRREVQQAAQRTAEPTAEQASVPPVEAGEADSAKTTVGTSSEIKPTEASQIAEESSLSRVQKTARKVLGDALKGSNIKSVDYVRRGVDGDEAYITEDGQLFINADRMTTGQAILSVISHELVHAAETKDSGIVADLLAFAQKKLGMDLDEAVKEKTEEYKAFFAEQGKSEKYIERNTTRELMEGEVAAEVMRWHVFPNVAGMNILARDNRTAFQRMRDGVENFIARMVFGTPDTSEMQAECERLLERMNTALKNTENESTIEENKEVRRSVARDGEIHREAESGYGQERGATEDRPRVQSPGRESEGRHAHTRGGTDRGTEREYRESVQPTRLSARGRGLSHGFGREPAVSWVKRGLVDARPDSVAYNEQRIADEYRIPSFVVSDRVWRASGKKAPAFAAGGQIFFKEHIPGRYQDMLAYHEVNHVMRRLEFDPYMDFLTRVPDMLAATADTELLLARVEEHVKKQRGSADRDTRFYDELNAMVYGHIAAGELHSSDIDIPNAFSDFISYAAELSNIHEQFKAYQQSRIPAPDNSTQNNEGTPATGEDAFSAARWSAGRARTDTPEFRNWFHDDTGELTNPGGTPKDFLRGDTFSGATQFHSGAENHSGGIYFSTDMDTAGFYAHQYDDSFSLEAPEFMPQVFQSWNDAFMSTQDGELGNNVAVERTPDGWELMVRRRAENRVRWETLATFPNTTKGLEQFNAQYGQILQDAAVENPAYMRVYLSARKTKVIDAEGRTWNDVDNAGQRTNDIARQAWDEGYDHVIVKNVQDGAPAGMEFDEFDNWKAVLKTIDVHIVKDSSQVKSVYNTGSFDPENPDVRYSIVRDGRRPGDYRVIADRDIFKGVPANERTATLRAYLNEYLRGAEIATLLDQQSLFVESKNKDLQKLWRPGGHYNEREYGARLETASHIDEAAAASALGRTEQNKKPDTRPNRGDVQKRTVWVEIPEWDESGKLADASVWEVELTAPQNLTSGKRTVYDISRLSEKTKDTHSVVYRLQEEGLDVDRASLAEIIAENLETVKPDVRHSVGYREYAPTFFSKMEQEISAFKQAKMGASSVVSYLKGHGVKDEEIKWSGIEQWLEGKKSVTKEELLEFAKLNALELEVQELDGHREMGEFMDETTGEIYNDLEHMREVVESMAEAMGYDPEDVRYDYGQYPSNGWIYCYVYKDGEEIDLTSVQARKIADKDPQWEAYKTPGGDNYRELLYKMPGSGYTNPAMDVHWGNADEGEGVLAHARVQDFETEDGTMLFIDEIQSDWHNAGAKGGYTLKDAPAMQEELKQIRRKQVLGDLSEADRKREAELEATLYPRHTELFTRRDALMATLDKNETLSSAVDKIATARFEGNRKYAENNVITARSPSMFIDDLSVLGVHFTAEEDQALREFINAVDGWNGDYQRYISEGGREAEMDNRAPEAPYAKNYHEYVLKRLIREAAEQGYDSIGWTTGKMQEERWSSEYAEGYRIEYDQDMPKFLNKYGKQWGAKVEKGRVNAGGDEYTRSLVEQYEENVAYWKRQADKAESEREYDFCVRQATHEQEALDKVKEKLAGTEIWKMKLTDQMREDVLYKGQPRFSAGKTGFNPNLNYPSWTEQVDLLQQGKLNKTLRGADGRASVMYVAAEPTALLQNLGLSDLPLIMTQKHAIQILGKRWDDVGNIINEHNHELSEDVMKQIPQLIQHPVMVLKADPHGSSYGGVNIITNLTDDAGDPVEITIKADQPNFTYDGVSGPAHFVNAFGRRNFEEYLEAAFRNGAVLYINKERANSVPFGASTARHERTYGVSSDTIIDQKDLTVKPAERRFSAGKKGNTKTGGSTGNVNPETGYEAGSVADSFMRILNTGDREGALNVLEEAVRMLTEAEAQRAEQRRDELVSQVFRPKLTEDVITRNKRIIEELIAKYGQMEQTSAAQREVRFPKQIDTNTKVRGFVQTAAATNAATEDLRNTLADDIVKGRVGATYQPVSDRATLGKIAEQFSTKTGFERALREWRAKVDSGTMPSKEDIALGEALFVQACAEGQTFEAQKLASEIAIMGTQLGQAVQAMSLVKRMTPAGQLYYIQKTVDRLNAEKAQQKRNVRIVIDEKLAQQLLAAKTKEEMDAAIDAIIQSLADQMPVTIYDKWNTWRYLAMLGNPRTHFRNLAGNAIFVPARLIKDAAAMGMERMVIKDKSKRTKGIAGKDLRAFAAEDADLMGDELRDGGKYETKDLIRDRRRIYKLSPLNWAAKTNSRLLEAEDWIFLKAAYANALGGYLAAQGFTAEQVSGANSTPEGRAALDRARVYAVEEAKKATYRDASKLAQWMNHSARNTGPVGSIIWGGLMPFTKTPINIVKRGIEYSPVGLMTTIAKGATKLRKGEMTAAQFIDGLAAGLTGTGIVGLGYALANMGLLVGGLGDDDEDKFEQLQGNQEYSIKLGDHSYTIDWMAPTVLPLFVGEAIHKFSENEGVDGWEVLEASAGLLDPIMSLSMLDGLNQTLSAVKYDTGEPIPAILQTIVGSYVSQGIPTVLGSVARTIDDSRRASFTPSGQTSVQRWLSRLWQTSFIGKTPIAAEKRMAYVDEWGRTDTESSMLMRALENFVSPGYINPLKETPLESEIARLAEVTGDNGVYPNKAQKYFSVGGETYAMSQDEYEKHLLYRGQKSYQLASDITTSRTYDALDDKTRAKALELAYDYAATLAKLNTNEAYAADKWILKLAEFEKRGGDAAEYLMLRAQSKTADLSLTEQVLSDSGLSAKDAAELIVMERTMPTSFTDPYISGYEYKMDEAAQERYAQMYHDLYISAYLDLVQDDEFIEGTLADRKKLVSELGTEVGKQVKYDMADWYWERGIESTEKS